MALTTTIDDGVAVVTIDHPPANLLDGEFFFAMLETLDRLDSDPDVRVLVLRSADPDFFMMHGDLQIVKEMTPAYEPSTEPGIAPALLDRLRSGRLVTIGLLDGIARGGGCEVLCNVDIRFGSERSIVAQPEVVLGIIPGAGGTARWTAAVGRGRALDILLTGRDVTADELLAIGWLDRLIPSPDLEATGLAVARRIAALPANAVAATKRVVDARPEAALLTESNEVAKLLATGQHRDRMERFLAAGGQTREAEISRMDELLAAVLHP